VDVQVPYGAGTTNLTSYWDLVEELWAAESDFILLEEDVLCSEELIQSMWECCEPWCSGYFAHYWNDAKGHLWTDSWLACLKFGSIRQRIPDMMARAAKHFPQRHWGVLDRGLFQVLYEEEGISPHLHEPHMYHLKPQIPREYGIQPPPWVPGFEPLAE
jgi:hypothetical protein